MVQLDDITEKPQLDYSHPQLKHVYVRFMCTYFQAAHMVVVVLDTKYACHLFSVVVATSNSHRVEVNRQTAQLELYGCCLRLPHLKQSRLFAVESRMVKSSILEFSVSRCTPVYDSLFPTQERFFISTHSVLSVMAVSCLVCLTLSRDCVSQEPHLIYEIADLNSNLCQQDQSDI